MRFGKGSGSGILRRVAAAASAARHGRPAVRYDADGNLVGGHADPSLPVSNDEEPADTAQNPQAIGQTITSETELNSALDAIAFRASLITTGGSSFEDVFNAYSAFVGQNPKFGRGHLNLANLLVYHGETDGHKAAALKQARDAYECGSGLDALEILALGLSKQGKHAQAVGAMEFALIRAWDSPSFDQDTKGLAIGELVKKMKDFYAALVEHTTDERLKEYGQKRARLLDERLRSVPIAAYRMEEIVPELGRLRGYLSYLLKVEDAARHDNINWIGRAVCHYHDDISNMNVHLKAVEWLKPMVLQEPDNNTLWYLFLGNSYANLADFSNRMLKHLEKEPHKDTKKQENLIAKYKSEAQGYEKLAFMAYGVSAMMADQRPKSNDTAINKLEVQAAINELARMYNMVGNVDNANHCKKALQAIGQQQSPDGIVGQLFVPRAYAAGKYAQGLESVKGKFLASIAPQPQS